MKQVPLRRIEAGRLLAAELPTVVRLYNKKEKFHMRYLFNRKQKFIQDAGEYHYSEAVISDLEEYYLWRTKHCNDWDEAVEKLEPRELSQLFALVDSIDNMPPKDVLSIYLEWNGIIGYDEQIIDHYENGDLEDYLNEEGIIGYTSDIQSILNQDKFLTHDDGYSVEQEGSKYNIKNKEGKVVVTSTDKEKTMNNLNRLSNNQPIEDTEEPEDTSHSTYSWTAMDKRGDVMRSRLGYHSITEARNAAKAAIKDEESFEGVCVIYIYRDGQFVSRCTFIK